jgi:hypothetical protein
MTERASPVIPAEADRGMAIWVLLFDLCFTTFAMLAFLNLMQSFPDQNTDVPDWILCPESQKSVCGLQLHSKIIDNFLNDSNFDQELISI